MEKTEEALYSLKPFWQTRIFQVVVLVKGPINLVCISCTEESYESLRGQLELLYDQMVLILTKSLNRCFEQNPKFDMTPLLGAIDGVFSSLIHSFSWDPATFLQAYTCLPLPYATRQAAGAVLQDVAESGVLFTILMCKNKVISLGAEKESLHPDDLLLLSNFVLSSESFRISESFSPICLPRFNAMSFVYAYVHYFNVDTYLMFLTTSSDDLYHLKDCRVRIETALWLFRLLRAYQKLYVSMHEKDGGPHKTLFRRDENYVLLCWVTADFRLYAAFDPLADEDRKMYIASIAIMVERRCGIALAIKSCNRVKDVENEIFFVGGSSFSWYTASGQSNLFPA